MQDLVIIIHFYCRKVQSSVKKKKRIFCQLSNGCLQGQRNVLRDIPLMRMGLTELMPSAVHLYVI